MINFVIQDKGILKEFEKIDYVQIQDEGILKEFEKLDYVQIQEKCKNLDFACDFLEYNDNSFVVIRDGKSISILIATDETKNKYFPLKRTIQK